MNYNYTTTNNDTTTLTFASKINYHQQAGTYNITLNFNAVANTNVPYIQDFTNDMCHNQASDQEVVVQDKRDLKSYTVRYINGNCWMTENLRLGEDDANPDTTTIVLTPEDSNVTETRTITAYDLVTYGKNNKECYGDGVEEIGSAYTTPCIHSKDIAHNNIGVWYNYVMASAGTISNAHGNTEDEANESVCPNGWRLPSQTEAQDMATSLGSANKSIFNPIYGGRYYNGSIAYYESRGEWWTSTADASMNRYGLVVNAKASGLYVTSYVRLNAMYVRCIRSE